MTVRVCLLNTSRKTDVNLVVFVQVRGNLVNFKFSLIFRLETTHHMNLEIVARSVLARDKHLMSFVLRAVFAVIHLHSVC